MFTKSYADKALPQRPHQKSQLAKSFKQTLFTESIVNVKTGVLTSKQNKPHISKQTKVMAAKQPIMKEMLENNDTIKFEMNETIFDMVKQSASSVPMNNRIFGDQNLFDKLQKPGQKYVPQSNLIQRKTMKKNILSQQLGALVETVPFNKSGFQNKIQPNLYQLKDQQLSKSKIFQSKSLVDNKDQEYFGSFFKIQQNEETSGIDSTYIDNIFALKPRNEQKTGRSRVAMMAHSEGAGPETQGKFMSGFGKKSLLTLMIASVFIFAYPDDALAARSGGRSGGRMGGRAPTMSRPAAPRSAPSGSSARPAMRTSQPQVRNTYNRGPTVIMGSPFGYPGMMGGMGYGGFGYSPFGYNPALSLGFTFAEVLIRENQRQQYLQQQLETQRQLGQDQAAIQQLQRELSAQNQRVATINQQAQTNPNGKYDENVQKQIEAKVDSNMAALQAEFKKDMDSGDFTAAQKVKEQAQQLMLAN